MRTPPSLQQDPRLCLPTAWEFGGPLSGKPDQPPRDLKVLMSGISWGNFPARHAGAELSAESGAQPFRGSTQQAFEEGMGCEKWPAKKGPDVKSRCCQWQNWCLWPCELAVCGASVSGSQGRCSPRDARRPPPSWQPWQPAGHFQTFTQRASDGCFSKHWPLQKFSVCFWLQKAYTDNKNLSKAHQCWHFSGLLVNLFSVKSIFLNPNMDHNLFAIIEMLSISNRSLILSRAISYSSTIWLFFFLMAVCYFIIWVSSDAVV